MYISNPTAWKDTLEIEVLFPALNHLHLADCDLTR
jgi:hypothetical protein